MGRGPLRRQNGFVRELLWVTLIVLVLGVVVLDAVSLYSAYERARKDSEDAARLAREVQVQEFDLGRAREVARVLLEDRGGEMVGFDAEGRGEQTVFIVTAKRHVDTYAFRYLVHVPGIEDWVERTMNPTATSRSD